MRSSEVNANDGSVESIRFGIDDIGLDFGVI